MNFIKKIADKNFDDSVHMLLIRYGKGEYKSRAPISIAKTTKVKLKSSFEFANDLILFAAELGNCEASGIVLSKKDISSVMSKNKIEGNSETKRGGLFFQNNVDKQELTKEQIIELAKESYFMLLDVEGKGFKIKMKKKLPKPGKDEDKIDDKFCQMELDGEYFEKVKSDFFWDVGNFKKAKAVHDFIVTGIEIPSALKNSKDFALIREKSLRVGKVVRRLDIDGSKKEEIFEIRG